MFIVVFDDEGGLTFPYCLDRKTGGLDVGSDQPIAVFETKADANRAIRISRKREELNEAMGQPINADFTEYRKHVKIRKVEFIEPTGGQS